MTAPGRYPVRARILHWLIAVLVFTTLLIGFFMVNALGSYGALVGIHVTLGVTILAVMIARIVNRFTFTPPASPATVGPLELKAMIGSEMALYALLSAQPLIGWAMVSAGGRSPLVFGVFDLPRIAPFDADLYAVLRETHSILAFGLVVVIAAHVSAVLAHTVALRDGILFRMVGGRRGD